MQHSNASALQHQLHLLPACCLQAGDAQIQTSVDRMQRVIELARTIRERHSKSVKMPVREVVVVHPDQAFLDDLTGGRGAETGGVIAF